MNWINKLLGKSPAKTVAPTPPPRPAPAPVVDDTARLRRALIAATNDVEREQAAGDLGRALAALAQAPQPEDPHGVWVAAICQVSDKALALAWLANLAGDADLGEVAIHARISEVRLAALQRVEDAAVLERVALAVRDKDKRVYRNCTDRLRQHRKVAEDARRAQELAAALRALLDAPPLPLSQVLDLKKEFLSLGEDMQANAECKPLLDQALVRLQQESSAQRDLRVRESEAQQLAKECAAVESAEAEQIQNWRVRCEALVQAQAGLPPWLAGLAPAKELDALLHDVDGRLAALDAEVQAVQACEAFLVGLGAESTAGEEAIITAAAWAALTKPRNQETRQAFEARWRALHAPSVAASAAVAEVAPAEPIKPNPPAVTVKLDHGAVRQLLEKLEHEVEQGHLVNAEAAAKSLSAIIGAHRLSDEMDSRLQAANAQLGNLRGWARWSTQQVREELIAAAEQLLVGEASVDELAQGVQGLREKWKQLNVHGDTAKDQWERFDAALKKAYEPVAAHRAEEAARQAEARGVKEALCAELESYLSAINWEQGEQVDYKALENYRQEMLNRWRAAAQAGFRDERVLRKRLDNLLGSIDQRLDALRATETERLEQLIAEAEALRELPDLSRAISEIKALQSRWSGQASPLRPNRRDGQKLWLRFRAACDVVFARRDAQRTQQTEQQAAQREERAQAAQGMLDEFAASLMVSLTSSDANSLKRALSQFQSGWKAARASSHESADGLDARARELQQQAQLRIEALRQEKHNAQFELLAQKAAIAESVEAAAVAATAHGLSEAQIDEAKKAWEALPRLPVNSESLLAKRWAKAPDVTAEDLTTGREVRETILLDLEIALGLPSPQSSADARRRRQLEHLQTRFGAEGKRYAEAETLLVQWYATAATPDAALDQRLAAVTHKLLEQADKNER